MRPCHFFPRRKGVHGIGHLVIFLFVAVALKGLNMLKLNFFQGIAEMAGGQERSRYELLEISDPSTLLVRGTGTESNSI